MKPFKCELKSALTGTRLMRSLLEIIASNVVSSFKHIRIFLEQTLKYNLQDKKRCGRCHKSYELNSVLFGLDLENPNYTMERALNEYSLYLQTFTLE